MPSVDLSPIANGFGDARRFGTLPVQFEYEFPPDADVGLENLTSGTKGRRPFFFFNPQDLGVGVTAITKVELVWAVTSRPALPTFVGDECSTNFNAGSAADDEGVQWDNCNQPGLQFATFDFPTADDEAHVDDLGPDAAAGLMEAYDLELTEFGLGMDYEVTDNARFTMAHTPKLRVTYTGGLAHRRPFRRLLLSVCGLAMVVT